MSFKEKVKSIPILNKIISKLIMILSGPKFKDSKYYWEKRYKVGGNSGSGSYNQLAEFKANILNAYIIDNNIQSVIEFGCGDGNQISYINYPVYTGLDVSSTAISLCLNKFGNDSKKSFFLYDSMLFLDNNKTFSADVCLSLDVIYHLVEEEVYLNYMSHLFNAAKKYVIIYSSNFYEQTVIHVKHRKFTDWIEKNKKDWQLINKIENKFKFNPAKRDSTSLADFYFYKKT